MRERRVGRLALPARIVAGAAGAAVLVTAAPPVYAQEEGGGEVVCDLHDPRLASPAGIAAAADGVGWWIVSSADNQDSTLSVMRVGDDCNPRDADEVFIDHQPRDPQALALDANGFLWVGDTGGATDRDWITVNQIEVDNLDNNVAYRYVFPDAAEEVEAFLIPDSGDKKPLFFSASDGQTNLYYPPGENQTENTPMDSVGTVELSEGGSVTGAAINADGSKVALRTESAVYEWTVDGDVITTLTEGTPQVTPIADEGTAQGIAYDADGNFITLASADGDGTVGTLTRYTPAAPAAEEPAASDEAAGGGAAEEGPSLVDRIIDLGVGTIVKILAAIAILGMAVMVFGIIIIRKYRKQNEGEAGEDDAAELGFAREESSFGNDRGGVYDDDPIDLGLDAGQPDPDLSQVARGGTGSVYGGARPEPSGNVYGASPARPESTGSVYGGARSEPSGNVYGASPARPESTGSVYGGARPATPPAGQGSVYGAAREEPQYGAFERGGQGSVYDNGGAGQNFGAAPPEPSGNVYGARPTTPPAGQGSTYGAAQGSVYGAGNQRSGEPEDEFWGPPEGGGATYGRGR
ncbi:hypothetical protein [Glycomyces niveus]|uniref:Uncharacterized protein n=1 Tax=Glycomyces niveus TaxID=2820287 RepID=A0ABS3U114_9ACTN|nr:hypothetical protein [Glycomyces sp. NEAU-S30]MBO3732465.1 hypothetical protein [Glycomyces sp. NEAU-S30]